MRLGRESSARKSRRSCAAAAGRRPLAGKVSARRPEGRWQEPKASSSEREDVEDNLASGRAPRAPRNASAAPRVAPASASDGSFIFLFALSAIEEVKGGRA